MQRCLIEWVSQSVSVFRMHKYIDLLLLCIVYLSFTCMLDITYSVAFVSSSRRQRCFVLIVSTNMRGMIEIVFYNQCNAIAYACRVGGGCWKSERPVYRLVVKMVALLSSSHSVGVHVGDPGSISEGVNLRPREDKWVVNLMWAATITSTTALDFTVFDDGKTSDVMLCYLSCDTVESGYKRTQGTDNFVSYIRILKHGFYCTNRFLGPEISSFVEVSFI